MASSGPTTPEETPLSDLLAISSIRLDATAADRDDAIRQAGQALVEVAAVEPGYLDAMIEREHAVSTYVGEGIAIPHGTLDTSDTVHRDALSFVRFERAVDWDGHDVQLVFGMAARGNGHIAMLARLATVLLDPARAQALRHARSATEARDALA